MRRPNLQSYRTRRNFSQQLIQRSHRRCDLIRLVATDAPPPLEITRHKPGGGDSDAPLEVS